MSNTEQGEIVSFKEYFEALLSKVDRRYTERFEGIYREMADAKLAVKIALESQEKAVLKAETAAEKRFDAVNEFRDQLNDQQSTLARKVEVDLALRTIDVASNIRIDALEKKLDTAMTQLTLSAGRSSGLTTAWAVGIVVLTLILSGIGVVVSIVSVRM